MTVTFYGKLAVLEIGQFKPIKIAPLDDTATIAIDVPLNSTYVHNIEKYIKGQLEANTPNPVWTKKGVQYIFNELNEMLNSTTNPEDFVSNNDNKPKEVDDW